MAADDENRLHTEVDRQLGEVRAACDGLATRSGLLIAALALVTAVVTPSIDKGHHLALLIVTLIFVGLATIGAFVTLMPWLKIGPETTSLAGWIGSKAGAPPTSRLLYDSKLALLGANLRRLLVMRIFFTFQTATTITAIGIALVYAAWK